MSAVALRNTGDFFTPFAAPVKPLRSCAYLLSGVLLAAGSAFAEAPTLSPEFWNYLVEFGDDKGEVFDPSDYAAVAKLPAKARAELDRAAAQNEPVKQDATDNHAASKREEQSR